MKPLEVKLFAPREFWSLTKEQLADISNGCGGRGLGMLVPNSILGLDIKPACDIHDYMYHIGSGDQGKVDADEVFLNNMVRICTAKVEIDRKVWLFKMRVNICQRYYEVVSKIGGPWYWTGKNAADEEAVVVIEKAKRSLIF